MITEVALTKGRHQITSPITGEEVTDSFFGNKIEDVFNVAEHMKTVLAHLTDVPKDTTLVVYVTGLTPLFQAVFAAWMMWNCSPTTSSVDMHGNPLFSGLVFAHYDRDAQTYVFRDALTGSTEKPKTS